MVAFLTHIPLLGSQFTVRADYSPLTSSKVAHSRDSNKRVTFTNTGTQNDVTQSVDNVTPPVETACPFFFLWRPVAQDTRSVHSVHCAVYSMSGAVVQVSIPEHAVPWSQEGPLGASLISMATSPVQPRSRFIHANVHF